MAQISQNEAQAPVEQREALPLRIVRRLANSRELTLFVLVVLLALAMTIVYPHNFPTGPNMRAVLLNLAPVGILVCGMMLLMIAGTFDLSVGSTLALSGVWAGVVAGWWGWPAESRRHSGWRGCRLDQRADRHAHRHQRADRDARHAHHLSQPDLCDGRNGRHIGLRQLRRIWPRRRSDPASSRRSGRC
ncbi:hypothetical protein [Mesorhizobium sp.]|uniref:hypothetical protein n=1 Tax=Mesorhizobium sp. TaxID=1871066 RepID=UPI0025BAC06B|nr:hypothetical protein [Mesorhizobium sp.]